MKFNIFIMIFSFLLLSSVDNYCSLNQLNEVVPLNSLNSNQMTYERFMGHISKFYRTFSYEVKQKGGNLVFDLDWRSPHTSAFARREGKNWIIRLNGGLARHRYVTEDTFNFVICHELGHHVGGAPRKKHIRWPWKKGWASAEGQSDYYATLKCLRRLFLHDRNEEVVSKMFIPRVVRSMCSKMFTHSNEIAICMRSSMAGYGHSRFLNLRSEKINPVLFEKKDQKIVSKTDLDHPGNQCRLDTIFAGSLCPVHYSHDLDLVNEQLGTCSRAKYFSIGIRPNCWFKPLE